MAHNNKSIWALNKYEKDKIIFETAVEHEERFIEFKDGVVTEHYINTKKPSESYSVVSRSITPETFYEEKAKNDAYLNFHDNKESKLGKTTCSIHSLEETQLVSVESPLDILTKPYDEQELRVKKNIRREKGLAIFDKLTETQKRRYIMRYINKLSSYEIGEIEGVDHKSILESLNSAKKKIDKNFK